MEKSLIEPLPLETETELKDRLHVQAAKARKIARKPCQELRDRRKQETQEGLKQQMMEHKMQQEIERLAQQKYEQEMRELSQRMAEIEYEREMDRAKHQEEMRQFNRRQAEAIVPPEPDRPARMGDYDQTLGISSAQVFAGEDLQYPERQRLQALQNMKWSEQQQAELEERRRLEREAEERERQRVKRMCELADEMARKKAEEDAKKKDEINHFNRIQAAEKKEREDKYNKWINDQPLLEDTIAMKFMREDHEDFHERPDHYRGMTPEEVQAIKEMQLKQIQEDEERRERERQDEANWQRYLDQQRADATAKAYRDECERKEAQDQRNKYNEMLAHLEADRRKEEREYLNKPTVTEDFLGQFEISDR